MFTSKLYIISKTIFLLNKTPMGHIAHLRKQLKSINTYDYIIMLIKRRKNKRPTGLNGHLSIRDFTLASSQKGSYLYINRINENQLWYQKAAS